MNAPIAKTESVQSIYIDDISYLVFKHGLDHVHLIITMGEVNGLGVGDTLTSYAKIGNRVVEQTNGFAFGYTNTSAYDSTGLPFYYERRSCGTERTFVEWKSNDESILKITTLQPLSPHADTGYYSLTKDRITRYSHSSDSNVTTVVEYSYDSLGRLVESNKELRYPVYENGLVKLITHAKLITHFKYNNRMLIETVGYQDSNIVITTNFDSTGFPLFKKYQSNDMDTLFLLKIVKDKG